MSTHSPAIVRLLLATTLLAVTALGVGLYGLLRPQASALPAASDELAAMRKELAELRHSVEITRSQLSVPSGANAIAEAERRIDLLEARARLQPAAPPSSAGAAPADDAAGSDASAPEAIREKVVIERSATGIATVSGSDPALVHAALQQQR